MSAPNIWNVIPLLHPDARLRLAPVARPWVLKPFRFDSDANSLESDSYKYLKDLEENNALNRSFRVQLVKSPEAIDESGPFQHWLGMLADDLFSPLVALFLPAFDGTIRISPIPFAGCDNDWFRKKEYNNPDEMYRFAGRVLGLALRPWQSPVGGTRRFSGCLGHSVRLVPSICKFLLQGDEYTPDFSDLRYIPLPN
jgi:hypothetical protein